MKTKVVSALIALVINLTLISLASALNALRQDFDDATPPALPAGWSSVSLVGAQSAVTSAATSATAPNAVILPDPASLSDTALVSPVYDFSTGAPAYSLTIEFFHKRGMESSWDGGVLEISLDGAPFVDVTSAGIAAQFISNGYNSTALNAGSPLGGRPAWTGFSTVFEDVELRIPVLPSGVPFQLRFRIASDTSVSGAGWYIDNIELTPDIDLITDITAIAPQVKAGQDIVYTVRVSNPSSLAVEPGGFYVISYEGETIKSVVIDSGSIQDSGDWFKYVQLADSIPPFGSLQFLITQATSNPPKAAVLLSIDQATDSSFVGAQTGFSFVSSSPALAPQGLVGIPTFFAGTSLCTLPPGPPPTSLVGTLVLALSDGTCSFGQAALVTQQMGAVAYVGVQPPTGSPPFPSPYTVESATAGLNIPNLSSGFAPISVLGSVFSAAPGTTMVSLRGRNQSHRSTSVFGVFNLRSADPKYSNNLVAQVTQVFTDQDGDGSADDIDSCPTDASKISPGACGCNVLDSDSNSNGIADCLANQNFRAQLDHLTLLVKKLNLRKYSLQRAVRKQVRELQQSATARSFLPGLSSKSPGVDIASLGKALQAPIRRLLKGQGSFSVNKAAALKAIKKLISVLS